MTIKFSGKIWFWRGPAPFYFVTIPEEETDLIRDLSKQVSYGWGMVPVTVRIKKLVWKTALFPKDGCYILPLKAEVRKKENLDVDDHVNGELEI